MKDKEWLKEEIWKQDIVMDKGYIYTDDLMSIINEVDEPEIKQLDKKIRELESYNDELIRDNNQLRRTIDSQESLSQKWIDENKVARIDNLRKMTTSDVVPVEKLKKLLVPKQGKPVIPQFVAEYIEKWKYEDLATRTWFTFDYDDEDEHKVTKWLYDNDYEEQITREHLLIDAIRYGYEVEKEKKYYVMNEENELILGWSQSAYMTPCIEGYEYMKHNGRENLFQLTEQEIKDYDERYWAFAQEVTSCN